MKVVFIKNNNYVEFYNLNINGYKFVPKRRNIDSLLVVDNILIKEVLFKKLNRDIKKVDRTIKLIIKSDVTIVQDCDMMEKELFRIINNIETKYINYFNEFEFFEFIKKIYILNMVIDLKKKLINEVI